ncbi:MAG: AAA family ATPase, partial [Candidatus Paceibacterota bacterium]
SILDPFLASSRLQLVAFSSEDSYHSLLEKNEIVINRFDKILLKETDNVATLRDLEEKVEIKEGNEGVFFTFPAVLSIADSAQRYFGKGEKMDKISDFLSEIVPVVLNNGKKIVTKNDVLKMVEKKTGVPVGAFGKDEKEKLSNLENILHRRIVGQDEAVKAISGAMRRARAGIENPNRPMGSFLFLGPTGVGKTETTKALSETFFGSEENVLRFDMSEYSGGDALNKLIGSFEGGKPGALASKLRDKPYGVLLLDEFEKTTSEVMNLFLQILDEGFFSDMSGKRVNARNLIIIATSNAGSDMIWEIMQSGKNLADSKSDIVDGLVRNKIFKPELLNRFDGVVLFHPIVGDDLRKVAEMMLQKLQKRLAEKELELVINDKLIDYLMQFGSDPKFGARPMNRAIQDKIEQVIADKMIKGEIQAGTKIELSEEDLR